VCSFTDYFVICSGTSERQLKTIFEEIGHKLKGANILPHHTEGTADSGWLLLDYGDVVVHILSLSERDYYQLDELWGKAIPIVRIQ